MTIQKLGEGKEMKKMKEDVSTVGEDYLKELKERGQKNEVVHLAIPKNEEGYPRHIIRSVANSSYLVLLSTTGMPPKETTISIDLARMIGAYAEGMAEAQVLAKKNIKK